MSSGTPQQAGYGAAMVKRMTPLIGRQMQNLGMSPRQLELNRRWAWYCCEQYESRAIDWDGSERLDRVSHDAVSRGGNLPGGFYMAEELPLKFRHPPAPYHLPRVIVNRFTGLMFSEAQHPYLTVPGDPATEKYLAAIAQATRLWATMMSARTFGGAQGTVVIGYKVIEGDIVLEVFDARWITPKWKSRERLELAGFEKRYKYVEYVENADGQFDEIEYWYRRVVDTQRDVVWDMVPVGDGSEPNWDEIKPSQLVERVLPECPAVWIQNKPVVDDEDGEPDCHGVYDMVEEMDALRGQATRGTKANSDPTLHIGSNQKMGELRKGSANALKTEAGGTVGYVEITGSGPKAAWDIAKDMKADILEVAQCVLERDGTQQKTATEVLNDRASMVSNIDILREQYGQKGFVPLLKKILRTIRALEQAGQTVNLPPEIITNPDTPDAPPQVIERKLPPDLRASIEPVWPPCFPPSEQSQQTAAGAVSTARQSNALPREAAVKYLKQKGFPIDDVPAALKQLDKEKAEDKKMAEDAFMGGGRPGPG